MNIGNTVIQAELGDVLELARVKFSEKGIHVFRTLKPNISNIQTTCPFHSGGQEKKPSFGISKADGKCHCFTCGWAGSLARCFSEIHGRQDDGKFGMQWLLRNFNSLTIEERPKLIVPTTRGKPKSKVVEYIGEDELDKYRYYHDYMWQRGLTRRIIAMFDVGYDKDTDCVTFPVCDTTGGVVFVARRSVRVKYFNYPEAVTKPVYGLYQCIKMGVKKAVVTESIFNCLTLWKLGIPAVSLIGLGTPSQYEELKRSTIRNLVLALDPDTHGQRAQERMRKALEKSKVLTTVLYENETEDINDLGERFLELKQIY